MTTVVLPEPCEAGNFSGSVENAQQLATRGGQNAFSQHQISMRNPPSLVGRPHSMGDLSQVKAASQDVHGSPANHLTEKYDALLAARADEMLSRTRYDKERLLWRRYRKTFRKTRALYEETIDPFRTKAVTASDDPRLVNVRALLEVDRIALENQSIEVTTLKRKLEALHGSVQGAEIEFMEAARQQSMLIEPHALRALNCGSPTSIRPSRVSSPFDAPSVNPLLKRYWEQAAQVKILGERLADNNFHYLDALATRQARQDRDEALSVPDEDFEALFAEEKMGIVQSLDKAIFEADRLKAECIAAGVDTDNGRGDATLLEEGSITSAELEQQRDYQQRFGDLMSRVPSQAFEGAELIRDVPSDNNSENSQNSITDEKINSWFDGQQQDRTTSLATWSIW